MQQETQLPQYPADSHALDQKGRGPPSTMRQQPTSATASMTALPQAALSSTTSTIEKQHEDGPPSLDYSVFHRKRFIFLLCFWFLVITDSVFMPIGLYFGLQYGTDLSDNTVFSIVTAALGGVSIIEYVLRFLRLWRKDSDCRPAGAKRWHLDFFHWVFSGMWMVVMVELIVGTIPDHPPIRLLAMPPTSLLYVFGIQMTFFEMMRLLKLPSPVRVSSQPTGSTLRPGVYSLIEDIVSVDGSGGTAFRERLNRRYLSSHVFRSMLERLTIFWALGAVVTAVVMTALIFTIDRDIAYTLGWSIPFVWAAVWATVTWFYVQKMLRIEKDTWATQGRGV